MAVGCPVIAFNRGAAPEIVMHRRSGFLVQSVNEMVRCISLIDELDRMVVRAHVQHNFTAYAMAKKYTAVYKKIIASSLGKAVSAMHHRSTHTTLKS
jgi:glycosyltransferase involved in cell wall biosynthesis